MAKRLTSVFVRSPKLKAGRYGDGNGLYLVVREGGSRAWVFRWRERNTRRQRDLGLGSARTGGLSLEDAREQAHRFQSGLRKGVDPIATTRAGKVQNETFGQFADALLKDLKAGFKGRNTEADWKRDVEVRCAPLRPKLCRDISVVDVLEVLKPIWLTKHRTATELRGRIERVLDAAEAKGQRAGKNPAAWKGNLKELLPKSRRYKAHYQAAPYEAVPGIVAQLRERSLYADTNVHFAAEYVILTAVRTGEARFMTVKEVNLDARLWTIPKERMKADRDHEVPLSDRAAQILGKCIPKNAGPEAYVFSGQWCKDGSRPLGMNAILHTLKGIYPSMTTHGCRSSFRDWAGDETSFPRDVVEMALAHKVGNEVEQSYRRRTALEKRRGLMEAWSQFINSGTAGAKS